MKKNTLLNLGLIAGFLCCYTEWGQSRSMFVAGAIYEILVVQGHFWQNLTHPIILAGLTGLLILLYCAFSKKARYWLNVIGIVLLGIVVLLFLLAGLLAMNPKTIVSTLPYLILIYLFFRTRHQTKKQLENQKQ